MKSSYDLAPGMMSAAAANDAPWPPMSAADQERYRARFAQADTDGDGEALRRRDRAYIDILRRPEGVAEGHMGAR